MMIRKLKILLRITLFIFACNLSAQQSDQENYSKKERQVFAKIYQYSLDNPYDIASSMKKCVKTLKLSEKRMGEILQAQFAGTELQLSKEELKQLEQLKTLMDKDKKQYDRKMVSFITANDMQPSRYQKMEKAYHSNTKFQTEVYKLSVKNSKN